MRRAKLRTRDGFPITRYVDIKTGEEFIRIAGYPVLLSDLNGERKGDIFVVKMPNGLQSYEIRQK